VRGHVKREKKYASAKVVAKSEGPRRHKRRVPKTGFERTPKDKERQEEPNLWATQGKLNPSQNTMVV